MSSSSSRPHRPSISPFRSRKSPAAIPAGRLPAPSSSSSSTSTSTSSRPHSNVKLSTGSPHCPSPDTAAQPVDPTDKAKENVTVTVRFRPLSGREINKGDEVAWYADGDYTVRNEYNASIGYGFDRVFGPATTTHCVYDVAAQHVVSGAMQGINGTVFAYGVTSSGKTHTMHGEQKSPGIIPLTVKDVFGIIQETPGREYLLRVSYIEIYNEVINDLLNPTGQNLRIREDTQGTYVEGIKEEVVLSPAHALSLIASGEEHRHVGSNNFNLLSSRSHTIFTLIIESSTCGENYGEEDVTFSQLHLIDLAGSESSKTETTGLRRKEGSYINKSLLTLGTVISKLTDGKASHIPYRDSKLTRLLQSSLSGHGRVSLICTVTPASSNSEETHNTLKFAHRSKHVEIKAFQNKIMDEKSLIKKYQKEISCLKEELQQLKHGMIENPYIAESTQEDLANLKLQLEAGQVKLQSRLEEEEQAKAALMGRIQRLTKLILVSTKNSVQASLSERPDHRRRHSFGEDELAYLPDKKREVIIEEDAGSYSSELSAEGRDEVTNLDELVKDYKRNMRRGMLDWFKLKKPENRFGTTADSKTSTNRSAASFSKSSQNRVMFTDIKDGQRKSTSRRGADPMLTDSFPKRTQAGDLFSATVGGRQLPPTGTTITDQMDLLHEQMKMLAGEVAFCTSSLKRLSEQVASSPEDSQLKERMKKLKDEISEKKLQMLVLEKRMIRSVEITTYTSKGIDMSQALSKLTTQLNEKTFELEIKSADNRVLQEQLHMKISENAEMQGTVTQLRQHLNYLADSPSNQQKISESVSMHKELLSKKREERNDIWPCDIWPCEETYADKSTPKSVMNLDRILSEEDSVECNNAFLSSKVLMQAAEIETLKQEKLKLKEEKDAIEIHSHKMAKEASYAKELASAAAVELQNLAEEVTKLSYENAKLAGDLAAAKDSIHGSVSLQRSVFCESRKGKSSGAKHGGRTRNLEDSPLTEESQKDLKARYQREAAVEAAISKREKIETELRGRLDEAKWHEEDLENELANTWALVEKMRKSSANAGSMPSEGVHSRSNSSIQSGVKNGFVQSNGYSHQVSEDEICQKIDRVSLSEESKLNYEKERRRCQELESLILRLKGEDIGGLDATALEELQNIHVDAITRICHAKYANRVL